jgi:hypothetical protein
MNLPMHTVKAEPLGAKEVHVFADLIMGLHLFSFMSDL